MTECFICLQHINSYKKNTLYCGCINKYHKKCLREWIILNSTCPICHVNLFNLYLKNKQSNTWIDKEFEKLFINSKDNNFRETETETETDPYEYIDECVISIMPYNIYIQTCLFFYVCCPVFVVVIYKIFT